MPIKLSFTDQMRKCIDECEMTRFAIGVATGVDHATISRFMNYKGGLSMEGMDAIARCIGMQAVLQDKTKRVSPARKKATGKGR